MNCVHQHCIGKGMGTSLVLFQFAGQRFKYIITYIKVINKSRAVIRIKGDEKSNLTLGVLKRYTRTYQLPC